MKPIHCGPHRGKIETELLKSCALCCALIVKKPYTAWKAYLRKRFCSRKCVGLWYVGQNSSQWKPREIVACLQCGSAIAFPADRSPANRASKYCSAECRRRSRYPNAGYLPWGGYVILGYDRNSLPIFEHIAKAECALRRGMRKGEVVHHVNGDRSDNSPGNLLICTRSYHTWIHQEMSRRYAREHFRSGNVQLHNSIASPTRA